MNILSFDIEEWYILKMKGTVSPQRIGELDRLLNHILELLEEYGHKATFFCLGGIAEEFPYVVKTIASHGHEIGCHSFSHMWINKMTEVDFREDTHRAVRALEDTAGKKILSFRAPAFSIGESNKWAFEILASEGIVNDASIFPGVRDFGGFPSFNLQDPCIIERNNKQLIEFPIPLVKMSITGKEIAYSGGGYFRLLPLSFIRRQMNAHKYNMCYFHLGDLFTAKSKLMSKHDYEDYFKEPGTFKNRILRYFKSNVGRGTALTHLVSLLKDFKFTSIEDYKAQNSITNRIIL